MEEKYAKITKDLKADLKKIELKKFSTTEVAESSVLRIQYSIKLLRELVSTIEFNSNEKEIHFFKITKPSIVSKFIYNAKLFHIESRRPKGNIKIQEEYFEKEIQKCQEYFYNNHFFYLYFRENETYSDEQYFLRKNKNIRIHYDCTGTYIDDNFATNLDSTFSKFMAYEQLIKYFQNEIDRLALKSELLPFLKDKKSNLIWTGSKIALIEMVYALDAAKVINNGNAEIKEIAAGFEALFNFKLGDSYRGFVEIKMRKNNTTKFLDKLKYHLKKRIQKFDK